MMRITLSTGIGTGNGRIAIAGRSVIIAEDGVVIGGGGVGFPGGL